MPSGHLERKLVQKIGFYDKDTLTEDFDLTIKLFKSGGNVEFVPDVIAWTYCPSTWKAWYRQRIRWAHGQIVTLLKHRDIVTTRNVKYSGTICLGSIRYDVYGRRSFICKNHFNNMDSF